MPVQCVCVCICHPMSRRWTDGTIGTCVLHNTIAIYIFSYFFIELKKQHFIVGRMVHISRTALMSHTTLFLCESFGGNFFLNRASIQKMMTCMAEHWSRVYFLPIMSVLGPGQHREIRTCSSTPIAPAKNVFNLKMSNEGRSL